MVIIFNTGNNIYDSLAYASHCSKYPSYSYIPPNTIKEENPGLSDSKLMLLILALTTL